MTYQIPDIPRFYTAAAEWAACTLYIFMLSRGKVVMSKVAKSIAALCMLVVWLVFSKSFHISLWIPAMLVAVMIMFFYMGASLNITKKDAAYFTIRAFVLAELMASLEWQLYVFLFYMRKDKGILLPLIVFPLAIYVGVLTIIYFIERNRIPDTNLNISRRELLSAVVIGAVIFAVSNISYIYQRTPFSAQYPIDVLNTRTLTDIGGFAILYTHYVSCCQSRAWHEVAALKNVLQNQYVQYRMSRESINFINQKYHDLKHQIEFLRTESDEEKRNEYLESMENGIKAYELSYKTGNMVLDTVFTSKAMYCEKHSIVFTCVADGTLLDFVDVMDLASIFGNALDNAIEYEKRIPVKEKRLIHVTVSRQKDFVVSRFENYYVGGKLKMVNGLPKTTKPDVAYHGYGLKSIRTTAENYGGSASVKVDNEWFILNVILPLRNV